MACCGKQLLCIARRHVCPFHYSSLCERNENAGNHALFGKHNGKTIKKSWLEIWKMQPLKQYSGQYAATDFKYRLKFMKVNHCIVKTKTYISFKNQNLCSFACNFVSGQESTIRFYTCSSHHPPDALESVSFIGRLNEESGREEGGERFSSFFLFFPPPSSCFLSSSFLSQPIKRQTQTWRSDFHTCIWFAYKERIIQAMIFTIDSLHNI